MTTLKADPRYQRQVVALGLACVAVAAIAIWYGPPLMEHRLEGYLTARDFDGAIRFAQLSAILLFAPTLPMTLVLYRFARRVQATGQFPPPGTRVIRDTVIIEGDAARRRGDFLLVASVLLAMLSLAGMVYLPYVFGTMR